MIKTIFFFGFGGFFTACYANALRRLPVFRKPTLHIVCTSIGTFLGYHGHLYEEGSEDRYNERIRKQKESSFYSKGQALADKYEQKHVVQTAEDTVG